MFCSNFRKPVKDMRTLDLDDEAQWVPLDQVYPGLSASDTVKDMMPHAKESFLKRCRDWYREAIRQILIRIDFDNPLYAAIQDLEPKKIISGIARVDSGAQISKLCPRIVTNQKVNLQVLDREWRSLLVDYNIKSANVSYSVEEFWKMVSGIPANSNIAALILAVLSLPQSTAEVERTFSKLNNNKTKLRNSLAVTTLEAIIGCSEAYKENFEPNPRLVTLHGTARQRYMARFSDNMEPEDVTSFQ